MAKKATKVDLEESLKKTQEELEVDNKENEELEEKPEENVDKVEEDSVPVPEVKEEEPAKEEVAPSQPPPDYKKKFSEEARQNQKIYAKNRKLNEGIAKASEVQNIDDEELKADYPDWEYMSETEKKLARKNLVNDKRFEIVLKASEEAKKIEKWTDDVSNFIDDPKVLADNPGLEGKTDEFKAFANEQSNHAVPFKILVSAFLHDMSTKPKQGNKGRMFEVGSGGPNDKIKTKGDKISLTEARQLMKTDYKKYKEYLIGGKIDNSEI